MNIKRSSELTDFLEFYSKSQLKQTKIQQQAVAKKKLRALTESQKMLVEMTLRDVMNRYGVDEQDLFVMGPYEGKRWSEEKNAWEDVRCKEALFYYVREDKQYQNILKDGIVPNGSSKMKLSKKLVYLGNTPVSAADTMTIELRKGEKSQIRLLVLDASKIDKKKLGFDTEEFFRKAKEQNKDASERRFSKFDVEKGLFDYDYPDEWFRAYNSKPQTEEAKSYRLKLSRFFTNYIFKASLTYDGIIPADAIIDVYGPGWVVANSKKTQGSKDIKDIYNAYLDKANSKAPALLTAMPPATREKLARLVVTFQHSENRFEKGLTDKDIEKNFNTVKDLGEKISAEAQKLVQSDVWKEAQKLGMLGSDNGLGKMVEAASSISQQDDQFDLLRAMRRLGVKTIEHSRSSVQYMDPDRRIEKKWYSSTSDIDNFMKSDDTVGRLLKKCGIDIQGKDFKQRIKANEIGPSISSYLKYVIMSSVQHAKNMPKLDGYINEFKNIREKALNAIESLLDGNFDIESYDFNVKPASENDLKQLRKAFSDLEDNLLQLIFYFDENEDAEDVKSDVLNCLDKYVRASIEAQAKKDIQKADINRFDPDYYRLTIDRQQVFRTKGGYNKAIRFLDQLIEIIKHIA